MSYHMQMVGMDYTMLILSIYLSIRGLMIKRTDHLRRFCHFVHSVMAMEIINVILRLRLAGTIHPGKEVTYWLYAIYFIIMTLAAFEWDIFFEVVRDKDYLKDSFRLTVMLVPFMVMVVLCIVSYFTGWLFYIDEDLHFKDGSLYILQYILPYTYAMKFIIGMFKLHFSNKEENRRMFFVMLGTVIPVLAGTAIQVFIGGSYIVSGCVVGSMIVYIELIVDEINKLDKYAALGEVNKELEKNLKKTKNDFNIIKSMAQAYNACYLINLDDFSYREISTTLAGVHNVFGEGGDAVKQLEVFCKHVCFDEYTADMMEFTDLSTVAERIGGNKYIGKEYEGNLNGWGDAIFIPVEKDENGKLKSVIFATVDVNNKKILEFEHENMLQMALEDSKAANRSKTIFLNNMSHDIRTPLNAIVGFTNLVKKNIDNKELTKQYVDNISDASQHLLLLINDILDINRIESGKLQIMEKEVDLTKFLSDLVNVVKPSADEKELRLVTDFSNIENRYVVTDRLRLEQILNNILSNAIKFTDKGGMVTFKVLQREALVPGRAEYEFLISDTGIGMSEDFVKHIFEAFATDKDDMARASLGSGLGMAITKSFVDLLDGTIEVHSEPGRGSEFVVTLSFATCNGVIEENEIIEMDFEGHKLLLVEDNMLNQEIAKAILEELGFVVDAVDDGQEAVDLLSKAYECDYEAVLMDIRMPRLNGYEATKFIRNLEGPVSKLPIVAMTANAFEEDRKMAFDAGMNGHLAKPIDIKLLKATLARVISNK